jgi:lysine biosynthesis protein LysW
MTANKEIGYCPECDSRIRLRMPRLGQRIQCRECGTVLEVVVLTPLELEWAYEDSSYNEEEQRHNRSRSASYSSFDAYDD